MLTLTMLCVQTDYLLMCSRTTERVFGQHHWHKLRTKLATWRVNSCLLLVIFFVFYFSFSNMPSFNFAKGKSSSLLCLSKKTQFCYHALILRLWWSCFVNVVIIFHSSLLMKFYLQGNIANVISTIQANRITEDSSQAIQGLTIR